LSGVASKFLFAVLDMCHLSLQSGDPTASGDSDKSKSEVNDEDEEVNKPS
jgi:hypothetical protein